MSFSDQVLRWMLKRHEQDGSIPDRCDLIHVRAHHALEPMPQSSPHGGRTWRVVSVFGELSLRRALLDGAPVIAVLPAGYEPALDLNERAYRRRVLAVEAQDLVAAASQRFSVRIRDEVLADAILKAPEVLARSSGAWTLGPSKTTVTEDEVRSVLLAAALGFEHKLERHAPEALLARWLTEPIPESDLTTLLAEQLQRTFGQEGEWLSTALESDGLRRLVAAGALAATSEGRRAARAFIELDDDRSWGRLRTLVERAVRAAGLRKLSSDAKKGLEEAQSRFHRLRASAIDAVRFPLLEGALETALVGLLKQCAAGAAPSAELIDALRRNLHRETHHAGIQLVDVCGRLVRFDAARAPEADASAAEWLQHVKDDGAWADLLARDLRRLRAEVSADLALFADRVAARYLERRDAWNEAFAQRLVAEEAALYNARDRRAPISLADVSRLLVRPVVEGGQRVFLVVLDGCDLSTFIELLRGWTDSAPLGLGLPSVSGAVGDDLRATGPFLVGVSPVPTLTVHARRALFAGEIPKNPILDERDAVAANAAADHRAFKENVTLGDIPRRLLLKDEVGVNGRDVLDTLDDPCLDLVAAVFNGVDDALASHETTPFPAWRWSTVGGRLPEVLLHAIDAGWTVLVTA
ncbi:MAG: BREX-2 system phosphatase PglZ, partial [Myxococcota bacterium]